MTLSLRRPDLLISPLFLASLSLLVINDWYLKAAYGNALTGKLSDFAGLVAFGVFFTAWFPEKHRMVFTLTGTFFAIWKLPLSSGAIAAWNELTQIQVDRVVDYWDLTAILALIPAYFVTRASSPTSSPRERSPLRRFARLAVAVCALLAFAATSRASGPLRPLHPLPAPSEWTFGGSLSEVLNAMPRAGIRTREAIGTEQAGAGENEFTVVIIIRNPPGHDLRTVVRLRPSGPDQTAMVLYSAATVRWPLIRAERDGLERAFIAQVVEPLRRQLEEGVQVQ